MIAIGIGAAMAAVEILHRLLHCPGPPREAPDWSRFTSYSELARAAAEAPWLTPDEFFGGPFLRFLEMSADPDANPQIRARVMEFCRGSVGQYAQSRAKPELSDEVTQRARHLVIEDVILRDDALGAYLLDVFDGYATHNYRRRCCQTNA